MVMEIGVAPAIPTEYIIFNVVQKMCRARSAGGVTDGARTATAAAATTRASAYEAFGAYYFRVDLHDPTAT